MSDATTTTIPSGTIVVGVDGSESGDRALVWAAAQASLERRALTLVHAIGAEGAGWLGTRTEGGAIVLDTLRENGQEVLDRAAETARWTFPDAEIRTVLPLCDPRLALIEAAEQAALLVVGSRGRGPLTELVLGSVSQAVTSRPPCPVVVARPFEPAPDRSGVLVGVDGDGTSAAALELAYRLASFRRLPLSVMHCFFELRGTNAGQWQEPYDTPGLEEQRLVLDESVAGMGEKFPEVDVTLTIGRGLVDDCLVHAAQSMDLVVVGAHPKRSLVGLLVNHHHGRAVADAAPGVVVVVPEVR